MSTLADYSAYDQVWDLRYQTNLGAADVTAMGNYLAGGGRMYLTGEHVGFTSLRNTSLTSLINNVGGGSLALTGVAVAGGQNVTTAGQIVNTPNALTSIFYQAAEVSSTAGSGFLVTETSSGSGTGSLIGWDFGDIAGSPSARMLVGFDINIFGSWGGPTQSMDLTENMATYLGAPVPVPGACLLGILGLSVAGVKLRKRA
jgi:hypothetical protein